MNKAILPTQEILLPLLKETDDICQPLRHLGITYFNYIKIYKDGSRVDLANNHEFVYDYYYRDTTVYLDQCVDSKPFHFKDNLILWSSFPEDQFWQVMRNQFNIANGITLLDNHQHHCDLYHFATTRDNAQIVNFYLNNINSLKAFIIFFKTKGADLINRAEMNKIQIVNPSPLPDEENIQLIDYNTDIFIKELDINRFNLQDKFNNIALTKRESECLALAMRGQSAKYIARHLGISHRTVEQYIERLKTKYGAISKYDLLQKAAASKYFLIHLDDAYQINQLHSKEEHCE